VGGGRSHLPVIVVPRKEKNRDELLKDPVGVLAPKNNLKTRLKIASVLTKVEQFLYF
jgi:hypothetical protein